MEIVLASFPHPPPLSYTELAFQSSFLNDSQFTSDLHLFWFQLILKCIWMTKSSYGIKWEEVSLILHTMTLKSLLLIGICHLVIPKLHLCFRRWAAVVILYFSTISACNAKFPGWIRNLLLFPCHFPILLHFSQVPACTQFSDYFFFSQHFWYWEINVVL